MELKLLLLHSIDATYRRIQITEMPKSISKTSMIDAAVLEASSGGGKLFARQQTGANIHISTLRRFSPLNP